MPVHIVTVIANSDDAGGSLFAEGEDDFVIDPVSDQTDKGSIFLCLTLVTGAGELVLLIVSQIYFEGGFVVGIIWR